VIIDVARLAEDGEVLEGQDGSNLWELEGDPQVVADQPVRYRVRACVVSGELLVRGELESEIGLRCRRCGEFFRAAVREPDFNCARELGAADEMVDLTAEVRETMILRFPSYPLCRPECKGLCARCGANRNAGECGCKAPADARWDGLSGLELPP
jgi:uncharacterized protein